MSKLNIKYFKLEELKEKLNKRIENINAEINAWQKVEILTKKDGSAFKQLQKNFKNAKITNLINYDINIYFHNGSTYTESSINIETEENTTGKREIARITCNYKNYYLLTVEEIKQKIDERIQQLEEEKQQKLNCLNNLENESIIKLLLNIQKEYNDIYKREDKTLYYLLFELFF